MRIEDVAHVWEAYAVEGEPLCIAGASTRKHPEGISISIYFTRKGRIKGVLIFDDDKNEVVTTVGKVPETAKVLTS